MAGGYNTPTDLAASASADTAMGLTWTNTEWSAAIEVQRKQYGGTYSTIGYTTVGAESYNDTACSKNTLYYYRIRYAHDYTYSEWSTEANAYTLPAEPSDLAATWSGKTATLTWTNNDTYTYIQVYYKLSSAGSWSTATTTLTGTLATYAYAVATESASYDFRIRGTNSTSALNSTYDTITEQTSGVAAPTNLVLTSASTTSITATWTDNSSVEDGYEVYYMKTGGTTYTLFETTASDATTSTITGLDADTLYYVRVRAKDGTAYSAYLSGSCTTGTVPDANAVIGTVTVVSQTALTPTWTCAATNEDGFYVYRSTDDTTYTEIGTADENATSYADTGLSSYTLYYYKVRAYNAYGVSDLSSSASATTTIDLDTPTSLTAEALSSTQIKLTWTVNAGNATAHYIDRKTTGGYTNIANTADGTTATYTDGTCSADTEYTYRVRAYSSAVTTYGDYGAPVTKKTLALGTDTVRRNEAFFALGNIIYIASETPQTSFVSYWRSKPIDFGELYAEDANKFKTVDHVQLEYTDNYTSVPITIYLSGDGGTTWSSCSATMGTASLAEKVQDFYFGGGVTGKNIIARVYHSDDNTGFSWSGLILEYEVRGDYFKVG